MLVVRGLLTMAAGSTDPGSYVNVGNLLAPILSTGLVGVVLIMLIFEIGMITKKSADRERAAIQVGHDHEVVRLQDQIDQLKTDVSELKESNKGLQELTRDKMLPALIQATDVSRAYVAELARLNERRRDDGR